MTRRSYRSRQRDRRRAGSGGATADSRQRNDAPVARLDRLPDRASHSTAPGVSPCSRIDCTLIGSFLPVMLVIAPSSSNRLTRERIDSGSLITAPGSLRETSAPLLS